MATSEVRRATARLARLYVGGEPSPEDTAEARRALATANIIAAVENNLASAPPLTKAQRERIVSLLGR
ncbi:Protein of unknown function [Propionibacterium freudenreichii]|nr:Protein of unknown function [Propionibacterium freudenreichii]SBM42788.1 Hypothetical protein PFR_JS2_629 [Propionibacterium freudenreichii]